MPYRVKVHLGTGDPCRSHATASRACLLRSLIKPLSSSPSSRRDNDSCQCSIKRKQMEEEEEGLGGAVPYLRLETRERVQNNEAKSRRRRASLT
jgi:hypothetical protein